MVVGGALENEVIKRVRGFLGEKRGAYQMLVRDIRAACESSARAHPDLEELCAKSCGRLWGRAGRARTRSGDGEGWGRDRAAIQFLLFGAATPRRFFRLSATMRSRLSDAGRRARPSDWGPT